jgi:hypothetical protein
MHTSFACVRVKKVGTRGIAYVRGKPSYTCEESNHRGNGKDVVAVESYSIQVENVSYNEDLKAIFQQQEARQGGPHI